jgi:hypothetical protein
VQTSSEAKGLAGLSGVRPGERCEMVRRVVIVEVTSPNGIKSLWAVARPHSEAVAAVRKVIPADHIAELSICRLLGSQKKRVGPGEVRKIETMTHSNNVSDRSSSRHRS